MWGFPAGLIGGRIYFLITTPSQIPPHWWGPFAIWKGGLGIWGGIAGGVLGGPVRPPPAARRSPTCCRFMDAPRRGCWSRRRSAGSATTSTRSCSASRRRCPWALKIDPAHRPPGFAQYATFQPTFLYEIIWNLSLAGVPGVARPHRQDQAAGAVRAVRRRLLALSGSSRRRSGSTTRTTSSGCG